MKRFFYTRKEYEILKNNNVVLNKRNMALSDENKELQKKNIELLMQIDKLKSKLGAEKAKAKEKAKELETSNVIKEKKPRKPRIKKTEENK